MGWVCWGGGAWGRGIPLALSVCGCNPGGRHLNRHKSGWFWARPLTLQLPLSWERTAIQSRDIKGYLQGIPHSVKIAYKARTCLTITCSVIRPARQYGSFSWYFQRKITCESTTVIAIHLETWDRHFHYTLYTIHYLITQFLPLTLHILYFQSICTW